MKKSKEYVIHLNESELDHLISAIEVHARIWCDYGFGSHPLPYSSELLGYKCPNDRFTMPFKYHRIATKLIDIRRGRNIHIQEKKIMAFLRSLQKNEYYYEDDEM